MAGFQIHGWAAWAPDRQTPAAWRTWAGGPPGDEPDPPPAPVLLRRRITPIGQQALRAAWSLPDSAAARLVFCARDGEFSRTLAILKTLDRTGEISPAEFTLSVHHALAGLLSIARHNGSGHTTLAAGGDSFGAGLQEAVGCLREDPAAPVLLVHFHEPLPEPYTAFETAAPEPFALALSLRADDAPDAIRMEATPADDAPPTEPPGLAFLRFLLGGAARVSAIGERMQWHWRRDLGA